jgi:hypothetical protein
VSLPTYTCWRRCTSFGQDLAKLRAADRAAMAMWEMPSFSRVEHMREGAETGGSDAVREEETTRTTK